MPTSGVNAVAPNVPFLSQDAGGVGSTSCSTREYYVGFAGLDGDKQLPDFMGGSSTTYGHAGYFVYYAFTNAAGIHEKRCFYYMFEDGVMSSADSKVGDCYNFYAAMTSPGSEAEAAMTDFGTAINAC